MHLHVHRWGSGTEAVLVHGGVLGGRETWRAQRPLTERWALLAPDRPGHGRSPDARQDFELEAVLIADQLLDQAAHLVGYSYGGIVAMLAAAQRPEQVRSLTVVEPPATSVARGVAHVDEWEARAREVFHEPGDDPRALLHRFFELVGVPLDVPDPLPPALERGARALVGARPPTEAELPLEALGDAGFPILAVSGGHMEPYETICDAIAQATAGQRAVVPGRAHLVPDSGPPFNERLEAFWMSADERARDDEGPAGAGPSNASQQREAAT